MTLLEWTSFPRETKPLEWPPRERECRGVMGGGEEGKKTPPTTRATKKSRADSVNEDMICRPSMLVLPRPQQITAADEDNAGP